MHIKKMSEKIIFLKKEFFENSLGERLTKYSECGRGWAAIKFKMTETEKTSGPKGIIYQVTLQRPVPHFHRIKWQGGEYDILSKFALEPGGFLLSFLVKEVDLN